MNNNKELAQKIIDKYISIVGLLPVVTFANQVSKLKINTRGSVTNIQDDFNTLTEFINLMEKFTGKFVKKNVIKKFLSDYDSNKDIK
jgi:dimeric dUTPase (all-alpha-NTP-PPase superfamily)